MRIIKNVLGIMWAGFLGFVSGLMLLGMLSSGLFRLGIWDLF